MASGRTVGLESSLTGHLKRHGYLDRYGDPKRVTARTNLLGEEVFREVHFTSGKFVTFQQRYDGTWWRNDGGGRYGPRKSYTNL